ncbi:hypothetical protein OPV22_000799 [Ensete ventricosum]|uniref:Uncharacterized protein n=1 Tax=Ensete ventricosum TaxID=4639 RepID=A0AAV8QBT5_ENSVE|nr:hypothetical protein OPV22_000799 [Ensete ventricosum]RWW07481.1 hypothetical protein GW17_00029135 [Ensete ventricosum]RWW57393.1 hypothetical protein BHE74_00035825 [Ensete ventricosum]
MQGGDDEEVGLLGGGGAVPKRPGEAVARLLPYRRKGGRGLRRCRILPPQPRLGLKLPRPAALHTRRRDVEQGGSEGKTEVGGELRYDAWAAAAYSSDDIYSSSSMWKHQF